MAQIARCLDVMGKLFYYMIVSMCVGLTPAASLEKSAYFNAADFGCCKVAAGSLFLLIMIVVRLSISWRVTWIANKLPGTRWIKK